MKQTLKKRYAFLLLVCMLTVSAGSIFPVNAAAKTARTVYTAFGDSIAAGYGLDGYSAGQTTAPADSYQALVADFLHTNSHNFAVTGDDSDACIQLLRSGAADNDLKNTDVITLSIGSNDLLLPFIQIVMDYFDIDPQSIDQSMFENGFQMPRLDSSKIKEYYKQSDQLLAQLRDNETLHAQAAAFPGQLQTILSLLRQKAPAAEIYVTNIYNPFMSIPLIGTMAERYIDEINQAFSTDDPLYTLIDVYTPFRKEVLTNVRFDLENLTDSNPDPHPSVQGHKVIAQQITAALKKNHTPKPAAIQSLTSAKNVKLRAKLKFSADADSCQIRYAASKNGTYQTLGSTSKKTYQTNTAKLKKGKTYYVKVRSVRTIKGVTYYGKFSSAKAVKILT